MIFADARVKRDLADNLQFWMTNLPAKLRNIPITSLAIPGNMKLLIIFSKIYIVVCFQLVYST